MVFTTIPRRFSGEEVESYHTLQRYVEEKRTTPKYGFSLDNSRVLIVSIEKTPLVRGRKFSVL